MSTNSDEIPLKNLPIDDVEDEDEDDEDYSPTHENDSVGNVFFNLICDYLLFY